MRLMLYISITLNILDPIKRMAILFFNNPIKFVKLSSTDPCCSKPMSFHRYVHHVCLGGVEPLLYEQ